MAPRVFVSYSHDSDEHKKWVLGLAERLMGVGVETILDQWDLGAGGDIALFMEAGLNSSERVLAICTDSYAAKANAGSGGVGYERMILSAELLGDISSDKVIPVLRAPTISGIPSFLASKYFINMSEGQDFESSFESLARFIHQSPVVLKPALGVNPYESASASVASNWMQSKFKSSSFLLDGELIAEPVVPEDGQTLYWENGPQTFARVKHRGASSELNPHELRGKLQSEPYVRTLGRAMSAHMEPNALGAVVYARSDTSTSRTLSQVFANGEIWGLEALPAEFKQLKGLGLPYLAKQLHESLDRYCQFLSTQLERPPPHDLEIGFSDISGYGVIGSFGKSEGKSFKDEVIVSGSVSSSAEIEELVHRLAHEFVKTCGLKAN